MLHWFWYQSKASVQLHSLLKGSAFWPQLVGMRNELLEQEKQELVEETAMLFLSRYNVGVNR